MPDSRESRDPEERRRRIKEKFDKAPALETTSDEVKALDKRAGVSKAILNWVMEKGLFGNHANDDTGWNDIEITRSSVRNVIGHSAGDGKLAVLGIAHDLIRAGVYLETTDRNEKGCKSHIFAGKAKVDGEGYVIGFTVNEDANGRRYYNHELTEMNKALGGIWPDRANTVFTSTSAGREPVSSIIRKYLFVK